jgi:two-component system, OmpR family, response regulator
MPPSPKTVLVAEDDDAVRGLIEVAIRRMGHVAMTAPDAATALALVRGTKLDLLVTDLGMPGGSGVTLASEVRTLQPEIGIVVISGSPPLPQGIGEIAGGAVQLLEKPFQLEALRDAVNRALTA